jgi:response regulator RpfG family c-di-GMP phosphodiesterase
VSDTNGERREPARVLLVDDEQSVLDALRRQLRRSYQVSTATSGADGLALLAEPPGYAVVLSDMRMPSMDGATFLSRARERHPDTVRMLLTGQTDLDAAIAAINHGSIFRFLSKPCPPEVLADAFQAAAEQHRLVMAERELLEHTLRRSVEALLETLSLANPMAFSHAMRIKQLVIELARALGAAVSWQVEVAAMLSQVGSVTLPPAVLEKLHSGQVLTEDERTMTGRLPEVAERLLAGIPRLEAVREIIRLQRRPFDATWMPPPDGEQIPLAARLLHVALDYDPLDSRGVPAAQAVAAMRRRAGVYDPAVLDALERLRNNGEQRSVGPVRVSDLRAGMHLAADVRSTGGMLLMGRGQVVTEGLLERLRNIAAQGRIEEPLQVFVGERTAPAAGARP